MAYSHFQSPRKTSIAASRLNKPREDGRFAEKCFRAWLNYHRIPYLYIEQGINSLSRGLKDIFGTKRPDFIILVERLGLILVDVKNLKINSDETFEFKREEFEKYASMEKHFNFKVWFAVSNKELKYQKWYWIGFDRASELSESKQYFVHGRFSHSARRVPIAHFIEFQLNDSIEDIIKKLILKNR